jgi:CubicO group peptidase (beta-lactamase class C family)
MNRRLLLVALVMTAVPLFAQRPAAPTCAKTLGVTWADIKQCMAELTARYPEQFNAATFGYIPAGAATPIVGFAGTALGDDARYAAGTEPILWQGSITKPFTHITTLLALERAGRSVDETVANFSPRAYQSFIVADPYAASRTRKMPLTIRQVLTMTAGFDEMNYNSLEYHRLRDVNNEPSFWAYYYPSPASCYTNATGRSDPGEWYDFEPGLFNECIWAPSVIGDPNSPKTWQPARQVPLWNVAQFTMSYPVSIDPIAPNLYPLKYSNSASIIGAFVTESLTGQTHNTYTKANFLTPLGMTDTFYNPQNFPAPLDKLNEGVTQAQRDRIAHMLNKANGVRDTNLAHLGLAPCDGSYWCDVRSWAFTWPEGGLYATPRNLMAFMRAIRDRTLPNTSASMYNLMLNDQLAESQAGGQSRTAAFAYARNGMDGFIEERTEHTVYHNGYPGTALTYDPNRQLISYFGVQRVMRQHPYFQPAGETFAEARQFDSMLTSMLENPKADNVNFYLDAARAAKRNQRVLRYESRVPPSTTWADAFDACVNQGDTGTCEYHVQTDYNTCASGTSASWFDLGPSQRTMTVSGASCNWWPGTGSYTENGDGRLQNGPFRLRLGNGVTGSITSNLYPNAYSIALWVRPRTTANASILSRAGAAAYNYKTTYQVGIQNGRIVHATRDINNVRTVINGPVVAAGQWYHVVARATKNGTMSLYVNGVFAGSAPVGDFVTIGGVTYNLGSAADGLGAFDGDVALAAVYNVEMTATEVQRTCNGTKYRFPGASCQ